MKFRKLFSVLGLGIFAAVSVGAGVALSAQGKVEPVKAAEANHSVWVKFGNDNWKNPEHKFALYAFNNTESKSAWGELVQCTSSQYYHYSYYADFDPEGYVAVLTSGEATESGDWAFNTGNSALYGRTGDIAANDAVWIGDYIIPSDDNKYCQHSNYSLDARVMGGATDSWSIPTVQTQLTNIKVNSSDELEAYGSVDLLAGTHFKIKLNDSEWYGAYNAYSGIADNFSGGGDNNIVNVAAGTFDFYFNFDSHTTYINDHNFALADEWGARFLANVGCDPTGVSEPTGWATVKADYEAQPEEVRNIIYDAAAKEDGSYVEHAVARYDLAVAHHPSLDRFIKKGADVRTINVEILPAGYQNNNNSNTLIAIIAVIAIVSVSAVSVIVFIRKRKHN